MLKIIIIVVIVSITIVLIIAANRPDDLHVERSVNINAAAENIFPLINDFHAWDLWTPYNKDPAMKKSYGGAASGAGATYAWEGNKEVGQGSITITESVPSVKIAMNLDMIKPIEGHNKVVFTLLPEGVASTKVIWELNDRTPFMGKLIGLFMNMDKMIGKDFEVGLENLKALASRT